MRFEEAVTGTLCGGALLLLLMLGVEPRPEKPSAGRETPAVILALQAIAMPGQPDCIEQ